MKLSRRVVAGRRLGPAPGGGTHPTTQGLDFAAYQSFKGAIHARLVDQLDLAAISGTSKPELADEIRTTLQEIAAAESVPLNRKERQTLVDDLMNEIVGLGPIEPLIHDDTVQDILVNGPEQVFVEKNGVLHQTGLRFRDEAHLMQIIDRIVSGVGRRVDESSPMVDARLADGSRVNVIVPPLSLDGPVLSIRKFTREVLRMEDLLAGRSLTPEIAAFLGGAVKARLNILISGGTGAGKTTLLNIFSSFIPDAERIITIEDSAELQLHQPHVVHLESRPPNIEGRGEVTLTDLMKNSLRMRPDRIIVGEARGAEVLDMLQAMNTGHPGSMSTIHANSPRDALSRMEVMLSMGTALFSERAMRGLIASAVNLIVQVARLTDGSRRVVSVTEVAGFTREGARLQELFGFEQTGTDSKGRIRGRFTGKGTPSRFCDHIRIHGTDLDYAIFGARQEV
jgi:pilus assembly protein CpaF